MRGFSLIRTVAFAAILATLIALLPCRVGRSDAGFRVGRAIVAVRTIHTAETQYYSQYGHYAVTPERTCGIPRR